MMDAKDIFIRGVWAIIDSCSSEETVGRLSNTSGNNRPLGDLGEIVRTIEQSGVSRATLARFARIISYQTAFQTLYQLSDADSAIEAAHLNGSDVDWCLFEVDSETMEPKQSLGMLHDSLLVADTEGREMRPPEYPKE